MLVVYYMNLRNLRTNSLVADFLELVSLERRKKFFSYKLEKNKLQCLVAELLVIYGLVIDFGFKESMVAFTKGKFGKPLLKSCRVNFNISHSEDMVVCAISMWSEVGIDIEKITFFDNKGSYQFFHPIEIDYFRNQSDSDKVNLFYTLWCAKESYLKYGGAGLFRPLDSFYINKDLEIFDEGGSKQKSLKLTLLDISKEYKCVICCNKKVNHIRIKEIHLDDLNKMREMHYHLGEHSCDR